VRTGNATTEQDRILQDCQDFGGKAADAAEIALELDDKLSGEMNITELLKQEIRELNSQIGVLEAKINQLENQQ